MNNQLRSAIVDARDAIQAALKFSQEYQNDVGNDKARVALADWDRFYREAVARHGEYDSKLQSALSAMASLPYPVPDEWCVDLSEPQVAGVVDIDNRALYPDAPDMVYVLGSGEPFLRDAQVDTTGFDLMAGEIYDLDDHGGGRDSTPPSVGAFDESTTEDWIVALKSISETDRRLAETQMTAASTPLDDGPLGAREWRHDGVNHCGMEPKPWAFARCLYEAMPYPVDVEDAWSAVDPDDDFSNRDSVTNWQKKANAWFREAGIPMAISKSGRNYTMKKTEGSEKEPTANP